MNIKVDKTYRVKFTRTVIYGKFTFRPLNEREMKGRILAAIIEDNGEACVDFANEI